VTKQQEQQQQQILQQEVILCKLTDTCNSETTATTVAAEASATRGIVQASKPAAEEVQVQVQVQFVSYIPNPW
jgi:hypothetical protein